METPWLVVQAVKERCREDLMKLLAAETMS
jgi:hypothetical protein